MIFTAVVLASTLGALATGAGIYFTKKRKERYLIKNLEPDYDDEKESDFIDN